MKKNNPERATVRDRLFTYAYATKKVFSEITLEQKQEIGNLVRESFFDNPKRKNKGAYKIEVVEPEGTFRVLSYPGYFCPVIDAIINQYFNTKTHKMTTRLVTKEDIEQNPHLSSKGVSVNQMHDFPDDPPIKELIAGDVKVHFTPVDADSYDGFGAPKSEPGNLTTKKRSEGETTLAAPWFAKDEKSIPVKPVPGMEPKKVHTFTKAEKARLAKAQFPKEAPVKSIAKKVAKRPVVAAKKVSAVKKAAPKKAIKKAAKKK